MSENTNSRFRIFLYLVFFMGCFVVFLYKLFPYERVLSKLTAPLQKQQQMKISMERLSPSYLKGIAIQELNIQKVVKKGTLEVQVPRLELHVSLLSLLTKKLQLAFYSEIGRGVIQGTYHQPFSNPREFQLKVNAKNVVLASIGPPSSAYSTRTKDDPARSFIEMVFAPTFGRLNMNLDLFTKKTSSNSRNSKRKPSNRPNSRTKSGGRGFNPKTLNGKLQLVLKDFSIGGGLLPSNPMGEIGIPRLRLGTLKVDVSIKAGIAEIRATASGSDADIEIKGQLILFQYMPSSYFKGDFSFKVKKEFLNRKTKYQLFVDLIKGRVGNNPKKPLRYKIYRLPFQGQPSFKEL